VNMTEQQQTEILLKHLVRIAAAIEQINVTLKHAVIAITDLDGTVNDLVPKVDNIPKRR